MLNHERRKVWKEYGKILIGIEKPYELEKVARHELETLKEMYGTIWNFSVFVSQPASAENFFEICTQIFNDKGEFQPKTIIAPIYYDAISQVIAGIIKEKKSSLKILNQLDTEKRIDSDTIGDNLGLSRSTASHYLTYLDRKFKEMGIDLIKSKRINYKKFWWVEDSEVFQRVKSEIKDYVF